MPLGRSSQSTRAFLVPFRLTVACSKKETTRTHSEGPRAKPGHDWVLRAIPIITTGHYKFFKLVVNVSEK